MLGSPLLTKHINNTSTCGAVLTENKLEAARKTLTQVSLEKKDPQSQVRGEEKGISSGPVLLRGNAEEEGTPQLGDLP